MTEVESDIPIKNIDEKENGGSEASSISTSVPGTAGTGETKSQTETESEIGSEHFMVLDDADVPKSNEDVEMSPVENNVIEATSNINYLQEDNIVNKSGEDMVLDLEPDDHAAGSDFTSPHSDESAIDNVEEFTTETIDINSSELPLDCIQDFDILLSEEAENKDLKRKSFGLEDESFTNNFEGMYTCDTTVVPKREKNRATNEKKHDLKLLDYQIQCVNLHCQSGYGLEIAPVYALTYFGQERKENVLQKVCKECFKIAFRHQQDVVYRLKAHKPVLKANFPPQKNDVVIMDATEEEFEEEPLPKEVMTQIRKHLPELLVETIQKYDLDFQLDQASQILNEKFQVLEDNSKLIDDELNSLEKTLRDSRLLIYKDFTPQIKHLPPLTIFEQNVIPDVTYIRNADKGYSKITSSIGFKTKGDYSSCYDIVSVEEVEIPQKKLPPIGQLSYPLLSIGDQVYIMKINFLGLWVKGRIIEVLTRSPDQSPTYRVRYDTSHRAGMTKVVNGKYLAYSKPSPVRYPVGTRVIALFKNADAPCKSAFYVGLVAEPPKHINKFRYLVFFDDGYAQYVPHEKILLVCECSKSVHEDIHPDSREFIRKYLEQYPERPMVKLMRGQIVRTEWNGKWWLARVIDVDGSLVKMYFDADGRTEWIYRGSTRLGPLYSELVTAAARKKAGTVSRPHSLGLATLKKRNMPYVEYSIDQEEQKILDSIAMKNVSKKSANQKMDEDLIDQNPGLPDPNEKMEYQTKGYIRPIDMSGRIVGRKFAPHQCGPPCTEWTKYSEADCTGMSPLALPLFFGFERQIIKHKGKRNVMYRAPCGRRLRTMVELHRYLRITKTFMGMDFFDFDVSVHVMDEFHLDRDMYRIHLRDISYGLEKNPVSCVNEIDHSWPSFMDYSTSRIPQEGVRICYDEEFLVYCDCDDDCQDKGKCECWKLTIEGARAGPSGPADLSIGYKHKRLLEPVTTGIFECNHRCKCSATCLNRVAQLPLYLNLQVFRTLKKGWGLRAINDIPQGTFICIYAGRVHTEQSANDDGRMYGDEYLAELDYIEVVERLKDGYESQVVDPKDKKEENEEEKKKKAKVDDKDYVPENFKKLSPLQNAASTRARRKKIPMNGKRIEKNAIIEKRIEKITEKIEGSKEKEEGNNAVDATNEKKDEEKQIKATAAAPGAAAPGAAAPGAADQRLRKHKSVREMYGDNADDCYIMDAKSIGNIGRYLNHSCQPNVFVQNVFVDCHDVRFPWVAFFALTLIKAGTELTWDYNYDIGSVPDKVLYCYCNKPECRGRLL